MEQDEIDGWFYRKWNSGRIELSCMVSVTYSIAAYEAKHVKWTSLPFTLVSKDQPIVSNGNHACYAYGSHNITANTIGIGIKNTTASAVSLSENVKITLDGKWK